MHLFIINRFAILIKIATTTTFEIVPGNEGEGLNGTIEELCNGLISVQPGHQLHEEIDSLNVSVVTGIVNSYSAGLCSCHFCLDPINHFSGCFSFNRSFLLKIILNYLIKLFKY